MKVFTCTDFKGMWPVGSAAVVVARDEKQARQILGKELESRGLELKDTDTLIEIDLSQRLAYVLCDGNY